MNLKRVKKVYVLYGDQKTGKTSTLCMVVEKLISQCSSADFMMQRKGSAKKVTTVPRNKKNGRYQDVLFAGKIQCSGKSALVGVATGGDDGDAVLKGFMFFDKCYPDEEFAAIIIAIREQPRKDGLGDVSRSFPLMRLEEIEVMNDLNVMRPFLRTSVQKPQKGSASADDAFHTVCANANKVTADEIVKILLGEKK